MAQDRLCEESRLFYLPRIDYAKKLMFHLRYGILHFVQDDDNILFAGLYWISMASLIFCAFSLLISRSTIARPKVSAVPAPLLVSTFPSVTTDVSS
jgi:hypothetical protein